MSKYACIEDLLDAAAYRGFKAGKAGQRGDTDEADETFASWYLDAGHEIGDDADDETRQSWHEWFKVGFQHR